MVVGESDRWKDPGGRQADAGIGTFAASGGGVVGGGVVVKGGVCREKGKGSSQEGGKRREAGRVIKKQLVEVQPKTTRRDTHVVL